VTVQLSSFSHRKLAKHAFYNEVYSLPIGAFLCWNTGIRKLGAATQKAIVIHLFRIQVISDCPVLFLGESVFPFHYVAIALSLLWYFVATILKKRLKPADLNPNFFRHSSTDQDALKKINSIPKMAKNYQAHALPDKLAPKNH